MPSTQDNDRFYLRFIELLNTNTSIPSIRINTLAPLAILLRIHKDGPKPPNTRVAISPDDLALVICQCAEGEGRYMALVQYSETSLQMIVQGDVKKRRSEVVSGLRDRVGWLFGRKVGQALIE